MNILNILILIIILLAAVIQSIAICVIAYFVARLYYKVLDRLR